MTAILLEHNHASRITAERLGLELVWRDLDAGNPDPSPQLLRLWSLPYKRAAGVPPFLLLSTLIPP